MKIGLKTKGTLNPLPVMSKDAFLAFTREWCTYVTKKGLLPVISIPTFEQFREYSRRGELWLGHQHDNNGIYSICAFRGYHTHQVRERMILTHPRFKDYMCIYRGHEFLNRDDLSDNFVFESLIPTAQVSILPSYQLSDLERFIHEGTVGIDVRALLDTTRQMISERSAHVHQGLFGGYQI